LRASLAKQNGLVKPEALTSLTGVQATLGYVDAFCTNLFNSLSIEEVAEIIATGGGDSGVQAKLADVLGTDYTPSDAFEGKSLVTGSQVGGLMIRETSGNSAVQAFNEVILRSGIVRGFIKQWETKEASMPLYLSPYA
jgi:hypothetical protein